MMHIDLEDLVGNAFVVYLQKTGKRSLSMQKIDYFADNVVKNLHSKGVNARLELLRNETIEFFNRYSEWFSYEEKDEMILLKETVTVKDLIRKFSGYLGIEVLRSLRDEKNFQVLLE